MKLIVGLGNPGAKHAMNRHNVGFMAVDRIWRNHGFEPWRRRFQGQMSEGRFGSKKCLLLKPTTYMNESGRSVGEAVRFFKLDVDDVVILHDELDLAPGKVRVKAGGGSAGHNGLKSLTAHLGQDYKRVRIGIGHPGRKAAVQNYVLRDFAKADQDWLEPLLDAIAEAAPRLADDDDANFMNDVARKCRPDDSGTKPRGTAASAAKSSKSSTGGGRPRQSDLARAAAERASKKDRRETKRDPKPTEPERPAETRETGGALAGLLRRWKDRADRQ